MRYRKYNNTKVEIDGILFHSIREASRYNELKLLERAGEIRELVLQPAYELQGAFTDRNGTRQRAIHYRADFTYLEPNGTQVVEDVKGFSTEIFKLKKKLFLKLYPYLDFREIK